MTTPTSTADPGFHPVRLEFQGDARLARWRPLAQWLLAVPHFLVARALNAVRCVLTLVSLFTVLFTRRIPRPVFDFTAMTLRYEWRAVSYGLALHTDYPPFDLQPAAGDDGRDPHSEVSLDYPEELDRWKPLYKWVLAAPHYVVLAGLFVAAVLAVLAGTAVVVVTGRYPSGLQRFLAGTYRYLLRVQSYVGLLTDRYPPFTLAR